MPAFMNEMTCDLVDILMNAYLIISTLLWENYFDYTLRRVWWLTLMSCYIWCMWFLSSILNWIESLTEIGIIDNVKIWQGWVSNLNLMLLSDAIGPNLDERVGYGGNQNISYELLRNWRVGVGMGWRGQRRKIICAVRPCVWLESISCMLGNFLHNECCLRCLLGDTATVWNLHNTLDLDDACGYWIVKLPLVCLKASSNCMLVDCLDDEWLSCANVRECCECLRNSLLISSWLIVAVKDGFRRIYHIISPDDVLC